MRGHIQNALPSPITPWERMAYLLGRSIILFILALIPVIFYTSTWQHYNPPKDLALQYLVMILAACWGMIACGRRFISSSVATPGAFFFLCVMVSTLFAVNLAEAWETVAFLVAAMTLMVMVPKFFTRLRDFEVLTYVLGLLCILVDIYALAQWYNWEWFFAISQKFGVEKYTEKPVSFMGNENYTADFMNMALPICFMMIFCHLKKPSQMIFFTLTSLLNFITMLYIDCNASYAGFMVSLPIVFALLFFFRIIPWAQSVGFTNQPRWKLEKRFRHFMVLLILFLSIGGTLLVSFKNPIRFKLNTMASWVDVDGDNVADGVAPIVFRLQCMDAAIRNIIDSPISGIGPGNFKVMHPRFESQLERKVLGEETLARKVHNDHLYHAVEFGVFGLFGFYWLIGTALFASIRSLGIIRTQEMVAAGNANQLETVPKGFLTNYEKDYYFYLQVGLLGAILTAVVSTAFSQTFVIASSATTYWLLTGVTAAVYQTMHRTVNRLTPPVYGTTKQPLTPIQQVTRHIPVYVRGLALFTLILPLGTLINYKLIGETWMKTGMNVKELPTTVEGGDFNLPNKYKHVIACFEKGLEYYPYQMEMYYILGRYYIDVIAELDSVKSTLPDGSVDPAKLQRVAFLGLSDMDKRRAVERGIVILQTDLFMNPNYKWAHNNLGVLYDKLPNFAYSTAAYDRVFSIDFEQIFAHYNMGLGYMRHGIFEKSVKSLETSLFVDPRRTDIYPFISQSYLNLRDYKRAIASLDSSLYNHMRATLTSMLTSYPRARLEPFIQKLDENDVYNALIELKKIQKYNNEQLYTLYSTIAFNMLSENRGADPIALHAIRFAEKVVDVPNENEIYAIYGNILYLAKEFEEAAEKYEAFLRLNFYHNEIRRQLVQIYSQLDQRAKALEAMTPIINNPNTQPQYNDFFSYFRLLILNQVPWGDVYPFVEKAVELGGDEARKKIRDEDFNSEWARLFQQDPRIPELLGPEFMPQAQEPETGVENATQPEEVNSLPDAYEVNDTPGGEESTEPAGSEASVVDSTEESGGGSFQ